jgi:hypothetical protein
MIGSLMHIKRGCELSVSFEDLCACRGNVKGEREKGGQNYSMFSLVDPLHVFHARTTSIQNCKIN